MADNIKALGAIAVTIGTAVLAAWWLYEVAARLNVRPEVGQDGTVILDTFQRAKDILLVVLPLFSASIAFWVGSSGTTEAKKDAAVAKDRLEAVIDASPEGVLERARVAHPNAFR
ncbi:MAG TPA: hypothetical protein VFO50_06530 [Candidatus Limnocylindrales bacterium]|nr:hypothetical protein [Candidatus Limnocylindrales bacterium]